MACPKCKTTKYSTAQEEGLYDVMMWCSKCEVSWQKKGLTLKEQMIEYNWQYRKKICVNCTPDKQRELSCLKVNNFRDGIQETHCQKLVNARTKKFRKKIDEFLRTHPCDNA